MIDSSQGQNTVIFRARGSYKVLLGHTKWRLVIRKKGQAITYAVITYPFSLARRLAFNYETPSTFDSKCRVVFPPLPSANSSTFTLLSVSYWTEIPRTLFSSSTMACCPPFFS